MCRTQVGIADTNTKSSFQNLGGRLGLVLYGSLGASEDHSQRSAREANLGLKFRPLGGSCPSDPPPILTAQSSTARYSGFLIPAWMAQ